MAETTRWGPVDRKIRRAFRRGTGTRLTADEVRYFVGVDDALMRRLEVGPYDDQDEEAPDGE